MENEEIKEIRRIRRKISAEFGHDPNQLLAYYQALEKELQKSGKYKLRDIESPPEKPELVEPVNTEVAD